MRSASPSKALFSREIKRLLSSPVYILNAGLGVIFIAIAAVALVIKKAYFLKLVAQMGFDNGTIAAGFVFGLCLMASVVLFTAPSISLEGKTLWIVKSLPISEKDILSAKLNLHIYLTVIPIVLASVAAIYVLAPSALNAITIFLAPVFFLMLSANIGLICNLKSPNFDWINETQVVKQSVSVLLAMLFSSLAVLVPGALYFVLLLGKDAAAFFVPIYTLFLMLCWYLTQKWIFTKGAEIFKTLG